MIKGMLPLLATVLLAAHAYAGEVSVRDAWARASAPGQDAAAVALRITSQKEGRLVAATSPAAASATFHSMSMDQGLMRMRQVETMSLPARREVALGSGDHIMLTGLKAPLKAGDSVPLTLTVEFTDHSSEVVHVTVAVKALTDTHDMQGM